MTKNSSPFIDRLQQWGQPQGHWTAISVIEVELVNQHKPNGAELKAYMYLAARRFPLKDNPLKLISRAGYTYIANSMNVKTRQEATRAVKGLINKGLLGKLSDQEEDTIDYPQEYLSYEENCYTFPILDAILVGGVYALVHTPKNKSRSMQNTVRKNGNLPKQKQECTQGVSSSVDTCMHRSEQVVGTSADEAYTPVPTHNRDRDLLNNIDTIQSPAENTNEDTNIVPEGCCPSCGAELESKGKGDDGFPLFHCSTCNKGWFEHQGGSLLSAKEHGKRKLKQ